MTLTPKLKKVCWYLAIVVTFGTASAYAFFHGYRAVGVSLLIVPMIRPYLLKYQD